MAATSTASDRRTPVDPPTNRVAGNENNLGPFWKAYMVAYNVVQAIGWCLILVNTVQYLITQSADVGLIKGVPGLYSTVKSKLLLFQTLAILEVVHSVVGFVRSNVMTNVMQVYSRLFILWAIIHSVDKIAESFGLMLVLLAWSITEVIRYSFYGFGLIGAVPYPVKWLRYTLFFILYPVGVLGELMLAFGALPIVKATQQFSAFLPNRLNMSFSFYHFIGFTIFLYIPLFPQLYGHMITQRAKVIGGAAKSKAD